MLARPAPSTVHELLNVAKEIFNGITPPSAAETRRIQRAMMAIPLEELGIRHQAIDAVESQLASAAAAAGAAVGRQGCWSSGGSMSSGSGSSRTDSTGAGTGSGLMSPGTATTNSTRSNSSNPLAVRYMHIFEDSVISMGIFQLPMGASIPLHDHPGMTVISRVLYGSLHLRAYDWVNDKPANMGARGYAREARDQVLTVDDEPSPLFPVIGNIHEFKAVTDTAVLDILSPPYAPSKNRDCSYYEVLPITESATLAAGAADVPRDPTTVLLEVKEAPDDFVVLNKAYEGVKIRPRRQWQ